MEELSPRWRAVIFSAAALAFALKILLAFNTYGSNDIYGWERFVLWGWERFVLWGRYLGAGLYRAAWDFNHPPFMIHASRFLSRLADKSGIFFPFWWRLPPILADVGSLVIVYRLLGPRLQESSVRWTILFVAISPALILISGFHGNTDSIVIFFLLLSILLTERGKSDWAAGAALGMAMCVKIFPLVVIPAMLFYRRDNRRRLAFVAAIGIVIAIASTPFLFQAPRDVIHNVLGYRSFYGDWGLSFLIGRKFPVPWLSSAFAAYGAWLLVAAITALSYWMNRWPARPSLFSQIAIVFFVFLFFAPGFGVQYLAWLVPFTVAAGALPAAAFLATSGAFLLLVYTYWSQGLPWYLADANNVPPYVFHLAYFHVACWLSILLLLGSAWRQARGGVEWEDVLFRHRLAAPAAAGFLLIGGIIVPMYWQLYRDDSELVAWRKDALQPIRTRRYEDLSRMLQQLGRVDDARRVAEEEKASSW